MNTDDYTTKEELDDLEEQSGRIADCLKYIEDHPLYQGEDLEDLQNRVGHICEMLHYIENHEVYINLDEVEEKSAGFARSINQ
jgi:hypothetical protein